MNQIHSAAEFLQHLLIAHAASKGSIHAEGQLDFRRQKVHQPLIHRYPVHGLKISANGMKGKHHAGLFYLLLNLREGLPKPLQLLRRIHLPGKQRAGEIPAAAGLGPGDKALWIRSKPSGIVLLGGDTAQAGLLQGTGNFPIGNVRGNSLELHILIPHFGDFFTSGLQLLHTLQIRRHRRHLKPQLHKHSSQILVCAVKVAHLLLFVKDLRPFLGRPNPPREKRGIVPCFVFASAGFSALLPVCCAGSKRTRLVQVTGGRKRAIKKQP